MSVLCVPAAGGGGVGLLAGSIFGGRGFATAGTSSSGETKRYKKIKSDQIKQDPRTLFPFSNMIEVIVVM